MKKALLRSILFLCTLFMFTACSLTDKNTVPDDLLQKMEAANSRASLTAHNGAVSFQTESFYADGTSSSIYTYCDQEKYVYEDEASVTVDLAGTVITYWKDDCVHEITLYIGDSAYEAELPYWPLAWYRYSPAETVLSAEKHNNLLTVTTEYTEELADEADAYGFDADNIEKVRMCYVIHEGTYEIQQLSGEFLLKDGTSKLCLTTKRIDNCEEYTVPEEIFPNISTLDCSTVTLIENPEEQAQPLQYSVPTGYYTYLTFSQKYESTVYANSECTQELDLTANPITEDITGYLKTKVSG